MATMQLPEVPISKGFEGDLMHPSSAETQHPDEFKYEILADSKLRMEYVHLTSALIDKMVADDVSTVFFLDKSARPVAWLVRELWPLMAGEHNPEGPETGVPRMPEMKFLNIDRNDWRRLTGGREDNEGMGIKVDESTVGIRAIAGLRSAFLVNNRESGINDPELYNKATFLDVAHQKHEGDSPHQHGNTVMVIDEVRVSGDTLGIAEGFLKKAFPGTKVIADYWMRPKIVTGRGGVRTNADLPVWYSDKTALGRGIGDKDTAYNEQSGFKRIRDGRNFFSAGLSKKDPKSERLREEIKNLIPEIMSGELLLRMNIQGVKPDERERRLAFMERINGLTIQEILAVSKKSFTDTDFRNKINAAKSKRLQSHS